LPHPLRRPCLDFVYTDIGRGHPSYLDGIIDALIRQGDVKLVRRKRTVFELSRGLSRLAWKAARWMYRQGSSGGLLGSLYGRLRSQSDYNRSSLGMRLLARDLRQELTGEDNPVVVAHPILVAALRGHPNVVYQHGELVAPAEALVGGASRILVPTDEVAEVFLGVGYGSNAVEVTGLCIEPALVRQAEASFEQRMQRLQGGSALTGAFFSSGAEPKGHVRRLVEAAWSTLAGGHRVMLFAKWGGRLDQACAHRLSLLGDDFAVVNANTPIADEPRPATLVRTRSRRELNALTARLFPQFDFFVAPAHERSNWALGLGLPIFVLEPDIGSFAPLNHALLERSGVSEKIATAKKAVRFGERLRRLHSDKRLESMSENGWQRYRIDGFETIARMLVERYG